MIHIFFAVMFGVMFATQAHPAFAQDGCAITKEVIYKLKDPSLGAYSVWDTVWGKEDDDEVFTHGMLVNGKEMLVVGLRYEKEVRTPRLIIAQIRKTGRVRWFKSHEVKGIQGVKQVLETDDGYLVLASLFGEAEKKGKIWLGFFNTDGELLKNVEISDKDQALSGERLVILKGDNAKTSGYLLVAGMRGYMDKEAASVYWLNAEGQVQKRKVFQAGGGSKLYDLAALEGGGFLGSGYVINNAGRKSGWVIRLTPSGDFVWQQEYPRGAGGELIQGSALLDDSYIFIGTASPLVEEGNVAAWVMAVSRANGQVFWQRFYRGSLPFYGRALITHDSGLTSLLIDAAALPAGSKTPEEVVSADSSRLYAPPDLDKPHARLLSVDPRGNLIDAEEFFNGESARGIALVKGGDEQRVVIGSTSVKYEVNEGGGINQDSEEAVVPDANILETQEGWLAAAVPVKDYDDPCIVKPYSPL